MHFSLFFPSFHEVGLLRYMLELMPLQQRPDVVLKLHAKLEPKTVFFQMAEQRRNQIDILDVELAFGGEDIRAAVVERKLSQYERMAVERQPPPMEALVEVAHGVV